MGDLDPVSIRAQGLRSWMWQRFSGAYIAVYLVFALVGLVVGQPWDYAGWRALFQDPVLAVATGLFFLALFVHAWVGGRDILMDYAPAGAPRFMALSLFALFLLGLGMWLALILVRVVVS